MSALLLNRDGGFVMPADGWYQLAPLGEFAHAGAGVVQVVDPAACDAMVRRFAEESGAANFAGLLVDFDHFSLDGEKRSEAAGWIVGLEARGAGKLGGEYLAKAQRPQRGDGENHGFTRIDTDGAAQWDVLTAELKRYEYDLGPTGRISYGAPSGYHDDCVMALALANHGRWQAANCSVRIARFESRWMDNVRRRKREQGIWA